MYMTKPGDPTTVKAVSIFRAAVIITAILVVMVSGLQCIWVTRLGGIGGIAVGFAAKDLLANFFGGLMIYLDRPFPWVTGCAPPIKRSKGQLKILLATHSH